MWGERVHKADQRKLRDFFSVFGINTYYNYRRDDDDGVESR